MDQRQFEQAILHMIHGEGLRRLRPTEVAYRMGVTLKEAERMLDRMVTEGALELDSDDDGNLFYHVPGGSAAGVPAPQAAPSAPGAPPGAWVPQGPPPAWPAQGPSPVQANTWRGPAPGPYGPAWQGAPPPQPVYPPQPWAPQRPPGAQPAWQPGYPQQAGPYAQPTYGAPYGPPPPQPAPQAPRGYPQQAPQYGAPQQGYAPQQAWVQPPPHAGQPSWNGNPNPAYYGQNALVPVSSGPEAKSPSTAAVLSMFFPGAGQVYNGQIGKGIALFFATMFTLVAFPLGLLPWAWSILDAYHGARRHNAYFGLLPP